MSLRLQAEIALPKTATPTQFNEMKSYVLSLLAKDIPLGVYGKYTLHVDPIQDVEDYNKIIMTWEEIDAGTCIQSV